MLKGTITAPTGAVAVLVALADATPVQDTLPGIVQSALQESADLKVAVLNFGTHKAFIFPVAQSMASIVAVSDTALLGTLTASEPTKVTSAFTAVMTSTKAGIETAIVKLIESSVGSVTSGAIDAPKLGVTSLLGKIEDIGKRVQDEEDALYEDGVTLHCIVNQSAGTIKVYAADAAAANVDTAAAALAEDVQFVLTETEPEAATVRQFGE